MDYFKRNVRPEHLAFGEISPSYFGLNDAAFRDMRSKHPHVKVIVQLRDPFERTCASLRHLVKRGMADHINDAWIQAIELGLVEKNNYLRNISRIDSLFQKKDVIYIFYEDLFNDNSIKDVCRFIGISNLPADFSFVSGHSPDAGELDQHTINDMWQMLKPSYEFCCERFGAKLPNSWGRMACAAGDGLF